jgi:hypothetical protein
MQIDITQTEADALLAMEKIRSSDDEYLFPAEGESVSIPLKSRDKRETFILDLARSSINLQKVKYQNRGRRIIILARLDTGGPPHLNPDGNEIPCPHIHLYREGFGDKWAYTLPPIQFANPGDLWQTLIAFMEYCNIVQCPIILQRLL